MSENILFFILAGILILVLIGVSIWSARREKSRVFSNTFSTRPPSTTFSNELTDKAPSTLTTSQTPLDNTMQAGNMSPHFVEEQTQQQIENDVKQIRISLPGQEPQPFQSETAQVSPLQESTPETVQYNATYTGSQPYYSSENENNFAYNTEQVPEQPLSPHNNQAQENKIITLYVVAAEGEQFYGEPLQQQLEALGFIFGEYHIFHRHFDNTNATSPILFSAANLLQPGTFDIDRMDKFTTSGLVFFMHLPSVGSDVGNLRLMINTVERFATAINGFVLDHNYQLFTEETRQQYLLNVTQA